MCAYDDLPNCYFFYFYFLIVLLYVVRRKQRKNLLIYLYIYIFSKYYNFFFFYQLNAKLVIRARRFVSSERNLTISEIVKILKTKYVFQYSTIFQNYTLNRKYYMSLRILKRTDRTVNFTFQFAL